MQMHDGMHSQESWSRVRGKESKSVGMAKMPVYHIKQSLFSERTLKVICPANSCDPVAQMAKMTVPAAGSRAGSSRPESCRHHPCCELRGHSSEVDQDKRHVQGEDACMGD